MLTEIFTMLWIVAIEMKPQVNADYHNLSTEAVSRRLLSEYPDQVDGFDRLAMVYEARGDRKKAAQYYRKAADFARSNPGFEKKSIDRFLSEAKRMESDP